MKSLSQLFESYTIVYRTIEKFYKQLSIEYARSQILGSNKYKSKYIANYLRPGREQQTGIVIRTVICYCAILCLLSGCSEKAYPVFQEQQSLGYSQSWERVESYPAKRGRNDDLYFFTPDRGYTINSNGHLYYTTDGGENWEEKLFREETFFRCLTFTDEATGFLGTIGPDDVFLSSADTVSMYETFDGGTTWEATEFNGPYPKGLCGLQTVSDKVIVGCGRVRGPSYFIRSEDGGKTWNSYDYNHLAGSLIAPYFYDEQHGILVGGTTTDKVECRSLVLETFDGGSTWDTIFISAQKGEYCWKVAFPTEQNGFISIQRNVKDGQVYVLQTKDGGKSWFANEYFDKYDYVQGIGFVNEKVGWMGGGNQWTMETRDGGETWQPMADIGRGFNKFQFFGDTMGYGVGYGIYKMKTLRPTLNGWEKDYSESGDLKSKIFYKNGFRSGLTTYYHENGQMKSSGKMKKNLRKGKWKFYDKKGKLKEQLNYKNGIAKLPLGLLKEYVGSYEISTGVFRTISIKDGQLYSKHSKSNDTIAIYPISDVRFILSIDRKTSIEFVRNEDGLVDRHILKVERREASVAMKNGGD